jgi:peptide/nickel transport system substrate-binding protein
MRTRSLPALVAILVLVVALSTLSSVYVTPARAVSAITAQSYDRYLKPCRCYGGTLKLALPSALTTLNWWVAGTDWDLIPLSVIYDRPLRMINGTLTWEVATYLEYSPDYRVLTMGIRSGIRFHDGRELTAEDVAFTINVLANKSWTYYHGYFTSVDRAEAVDRYTVRVYFKQPDSQFVLNSLTVVRIMPKHIWEPLLRSMGDELAKYSPKPEELVGSGPFIFVERVPGQYIKFRVNKDYWLGRPCVDEILLIPITDVSVVILGIQRGDLDTYTWGVEASVVPTLLANPNIGIHVYTSEYFYHWGLNNQVWPLNISKFRLALHYAVDKATIVRDVMLGYGMVGSPGVVAPFGSCAPWYNPNVEKLVYYDPRKAAQILDEIGFTDKDGDGWRDGPRGEPVVIKIYSPTPGYDPVRARVAVLLQEFLAKIPGGGIKTEVYYYEWATLWPMIREGKVMTWLLGSGWGADISWLYSRFHCPPGGSGNWARYCNPEVDKLVEELKSSFNETRRREIAWRVQEILALESPVINLYYQAFPTPYRVDKFDNWFLSPSDNIDNRINLLRLSLRSELCPVQVTKPPETPTPSPVPTTTRAAPATTAPPTTQTAGPSQTTATSPTQPPTTPTAAGPGYTTALVAAVVAVVIVAVALVALRRR